MIMHYGHGGYATILLYGRYRAPRYRHPTQTHEISYRSENNDPATAPNGVPLATADQTLPPHAALVCSDRPHAVLRCADALSCRTGYGSEGWEFESLRARQSQQRI